MRFFCQVLLLAPVLFLGLQTLQTAQAVGKSAQPREGEVDVVMRVGMEAEISTSLLGSFTISAHIAFRSDSARITETVKFDEAEGAIANAELYKLLGSQTITTILDGNAGVAYVLDAASKTAIKLAISDVNLTGAGDIGNPLDVLNPEAYPEGAHIKSLGEATFKGKSCTRYLVSYSVSGLKGTCEVYVDKNNLPVYLKGTIMGSTFEAEYSNYKFHPVEPGLFRVPADYEVVDMASIVKGMEDKILGTL